jgi:hypothetical protein
MKMTQPNLGLPFLFLLCVSTASAAQLSVEKLVNEQQLFVGGNATILLRFVNPFNQSIPIRIVDKNVIGNNGLDIQCGEYTLPREYQTVVGYEPIKPFDSGQFTLGKARITYINPDSKKEETVESNNLTIDVEKSNLNQQAQAQGITTIYQCDGQNIRTTSYSSSGSSTNVQISSQSSSTQQQMNQSQQELEQRMQQNRQNAQNNQLPQDTQALKQEMEQQNAMTEEFRKSLENNKQFQQLQQEMRRQGFNLTDQSYTPQGKNTGSFELNYQNQNGTNAKVAGAMQNGTLKDVKKTVEKTRATGHALIYLLLSIVSMTAALGLVVYKRYHSKGKSVAAEKALDEPIDYRSIAESMLKEAQGLFDSGKEKDSYAKVSEAVRFYHMHAHSLNKELTNTDLVKYLKRNNLGYAKVQKCLSLCTLVEFAKYKPNRQDFATIMKLASETIKREKIKYSQTKSRIA